MIGSDSLQATPHLDPIGLQYFKDAMSRCSCLLEYGSGGSTVYAANVANVPAIISVETDRQWLMRVREAIGQRRNLFLEHCDVGEVKEWGVPKNNDQFANYWAYMSAPWRIAKNNQLFPDIVFIDGRFRVASFLFSLLSSRVGTTLLFDDYFDRPHYFIVEQFCQFESQQGRMAVFHAHRHYSVTDICVAIAKHSVLSES
jgi:hypothetical protein